MGKTSITTPLQHLAQKYKYAFQIIEKPAFALIKISILLLWNRFFGHFETFHRTCWVMIAITIAWGSAFFFGTIFQCGITWSRNWAAIGVFLTRCSNTLDMLSVFASTDIVTDLIIILMPVPILWKLKVRARKRAAIIAIFMGGIM